MEYTQADEDRPSITRKLSSATEEEIERVARMPVKSDMSEKDIMITKLELELETKDAALHNLEYAKAKFHKDSMQQIQNLKARIHELEASQSSGNSELQKENDQLRKTINTLKAHKESKHLLNEKLSRQLFEAVSQNERLRVELEQCMRKLEEHKQLISELKPSPEHSQMNVSDKKKNEENDEIVKKLLREIAELNEELDTAQAATSELEGAYMARLQDSSQEVEYLRELLQKAEAKSARSNSAADTLPMAETLRGLRRRDKRLYDLICAVAEHEKDHGTSTRSPGTKGAVRPPLDIHDIVYLLECGVFTLHHSDESHGAFDKENEETDDYALLHGRPSIDRTPRRRVHKSSKECTLRLMDFMNHSQILEIAEYLCTTPLLMAVRGSGQSNTTSLAMNIGESSVRHNTSPGIKELSDSTRKRVQISEDTVVLGGGSPEIRRDYEEAKMSPENVPCASPEVESATRKLYPDSDEASEELVKGKEKMIRKPDLPEMVSEYGNDEYNEEDDNLEDVGEHVCFTIHRGGGLPSEKWIQFNDPSSGLKYYYNPDSGVTQWEMPSEIEQTILPSGQLPPANTESIHSAVKGNSKTNSLISFEDMSEEEYREYIRTGTVAVRSRALQEASDSYHIL